MDTPRSFGNQAHTRSIFFRLQKFPIWKELRKTPIGKSHLIASPILAYWETQEKSVSLGRALQARPREATERLSLSLILSRLYDVRRWSRAAERGMAADAAAVTSVAAGDSAADRVLGRHGLWRARQGAEDGPRARDSWSARG